LDTSVDLSLDARQLGFQFHGFLPQLADLPPDTLPALSFKLTKPFSVGGDITQPAQHELLRHFRVDAVQSSFGTLGAVRVVAMAFTVGGVRALALKPLTTLTAGQEPGEQVEVVLGAAAMVTGGTSVHHHEGCAFRRVRLYNR